MSWADPLGVLAPMLALENTNNYVQSLATFHESYDYFLTPTLATPPLAVGATATSPRLQSVLPGHQQVARRKSAGVHRDSR